MFDLSRRPRLALFLRSQPQDPFWNSAPSGSRSSIPAFFFFSLSFSHFLFFSNSLLARSSIFPPATRPTPRPCKHSSENFQKRRCFYTRMTPVCLLYGHSLFSRPTNSLHMASLSGSHFSPNVPLGKFLSTQNRPFRPRRLHHMPWIYAVPAGSSYFSGSLLTACHRQSQPDIGLRDNLSS